MSPVRVLEWRQTVERVHASDHSLGNSWIERAPTGGGGYMECVFFDDHALAKSTAHVKSATHAIGCIKDTE